MLVGMQTKNLIVVSGKSNKDILWSAFAHYQLVESMCSVFRKGGGDETEYYIIFGDRIGLDEIVLEMGQWPIARQIEWE
jgi:hypothetical protein